MANIITTTFQFKRGTAAKWRELNLILASGEPGFETDTGKFKLGNGRDAWLDLDYANPEWLYIAETVTDFPEQGDVKKLYKATSEQALYQWNPKIRTYEILSAGNEGGVVDDELSDQSTNAIANKTVTETFNQVNEDLRTTARSVTTLVGEDTDKSVRTIVEEITSSQEFLEKLVEAFPKAEEAIL